MTLRQRWAQWRERARIVNRTDLSVAEKVAVLQGRIVEPFLRRTVAATDAMVDLGRGIGKTNVVVQRLNEALEEIPVVYGGPASVECECGKRHTISPSSLTMDQVTPDGRLRRSALCKLED